MKKKITYIIFTLICLLSFCFAVRADSINISQRECPAAYLWLRHEGGDSSTNRVDGINMYNLFKNWNSSKNNVGAIGQAHCLKPGAPADSYYNWGAPYANSVGRHTCGRAIDPSNTSNRNLQAYDVALTIAYQKMLSSGYLTNTEKKGEATNSDRRTGSIIGTILARWISSHYGYLESIGGDDYKYTAFTYANRNSSYYWNLNNGKYKAAKTILNTAIKYGDYVKNGKKTYEQLVASGIIWQDEWVTTVNDITGPENNQVTLNVTIAVKNASKRPAIVNWDDFEFKTKNSNTTVSAVKVSNNGTKSGTFNITLTKKKGKWDEKYNLATVVVNFNDKKSPNAHLFIYKPTYNPPFQKFLFIKNYVESFEIKREIKFDPSTICLCETDASDNYTGKYVLHSYENGKSVSTEILEPTDPKVVANGCPDKCGDEIEHECERIVNGDGTVTYYGKEGADGSSRVVDQATYKNECLHICETPDENDQKVYYCADPRNDTNARVCNGQEYIEECYCAPRKTKCEANPNDPDCADYAEKCPNCSASSSVPGTCNDFDVNSTASGSINDVNKTKTACNSSENNIKMCVLGKKDMSGASYEATNIISGNRYCKVYCEESYEFKVPTARHSTSGGYFTLSTEIKGTRNCYTASANDPIEGIDYNDLIRDVSGLNEELIRYWNEWSKWKACLAGTGSDPVTKTEKTYTCNDYVQIVNKTYTTVKGEKVTTSKSNLSTLEANSRNEYTMRNNTINSYVSQFQKCTSWLSTNESDLNFNPTINFNYNNYGYEESSGTFQRTGEVQSSSSTSYCVGNIDNKYNCIGSVSNTNPVNPTVFQYVSCNDTTCNWNNLNLTKANWIKKSVTKSATYVPGQNFNTYHQYGTVKTGSICAGTSYNTCLWTRLPDDALPVELKTGKGAFKFTLNYSNIGQSNSDGSLGRLVGKPNSVLNAYNSSKTGQCENNTNGKSTLDQDVGYVCAYINNCDDCGVGCEGDNCTIHETCEGECPVSCKTCIFDGENTTYKFRTVSLNNLFPNSCTSNSTNCRKEGYNWQTLKAQVTKKEIEDQGNSVYEEPEYSYTVTASQIMAIRDYNKQVGSYENTTLPDGTNAYQCEKKAYNGLDYSVNCVSEFLNDDSGKYFTQISRNTKGFKLWTETDYCPNGNCLSRTDGIGPSWK